MADFATTTSIGNDPSDDGPIGVAQLLIDNVFDVTLPTVLTGWVVLACGADTTAVLVEIVRTGSGDFVVASANYGAAEATDPAIGAPFFVAGIDPPGNAGQQTYILRVTCTDASGAGKTLGVYLDARYDTPNHFLND